MINVQLTWPEILFAAQVGIMRRVNAVKNKRAEPYGARPRSVWDNDINGALAEMAVAKHYNVFWSGTVGRIDSPDVGVLQVRSKTQAEHRLVVRGEDDDDELFISVLVDLPTCVICGWMNGKAAKRAEWLFNDPSRPPLYFIPNTSLNPIEALPSVQQAAE